MALYTLTRAGNLSNGNAADAAGAAMLLLEPGQQAAAMGGGPVRHPPHSFPQSDPLSKPQVMLDGLCHGLCQVHVAEHVTAVSAQLNTLFGELTLCATNVTAPGGVTCAPTWDCLCEPQGHGDNSPPHCVTKDLGDPCECAQWGGCKGHDNTGVRTVGWRALHSASFAASQQGNLYSTMHGGDCAAGSSADMVCTWRQMSTGRTVRRQCLESALRAQVSLAGDRRGASLALAWERSFAGCPTVSAHAAESDE